MKKAFEGRINRLDTAEERSSELTNTTESSQTKKQREQRLKQNRQKSGECEMVCKRC